ncbi:MAG: UvrD-helicase domain-containing protein, partial [Chthoniobacteraceae bacterium]
MTTPHDQSARERFATELDSNFSVVASAGSGKTRAITDRIVAVAQSAHAIEWLPSLVVVTFTNRAADEMQQRARQRILEAGVNPTVMAAFNRAFFGTIHSYCVKLLHAHGHLLGLRGEFDSSRRDDDALWMEFVQQHAVLGAALAPEHRKTLHRLVEARQLMELGRADGAGWIKTVADPGEFPAVDFDDVLAYVPKRKQSLPTVEAAQKQLRRWIAAWNVPDAFAPLPSTDKGGAEFLALWAAAFTPLREWVRGASLSVASEVARAYRAFRLERGVLTFDDQVSLARELFDHPAAARRLREKQYRVILDEAQDTDPAQFSVLLETTRSPSAEGTWPNADDPPQRGHFCMVGDFQQSIYGSRADLAVYRQLHEALVATTGEALTFSVTFRLDQKPLSFIDTCFPAILRGTEGQAAFVPLNPRPAILPGQVNRMDLGEIPDLSDWNDARKARFEADRVADWLRRHGLANLRARTWSDVAILCPRKAWFSPLRNALRSVGFEVQVQSERDIAGDSPAFAWFTALLVMMAHPSDAFEIVGVLREVFGHSDHDLAVFAEGHGERFHLTAPLFPTGVVGDTLRLLAETHQRASALPLYSAARDVVNATRLRDRLLTLPSEEYEGLETELDHLLTRAAQAEASGQSLAEFVAQLREDFSAPRAVRAPRSDAVQLITAQKGKGSEWSVVLVPFLARGIRSRSSPFPRLVRPAGTGEMHPALSREDIDAALKKLLENQETQEMQRLLYVTVTRAKHTLVLIDDESLFRGKGGVSRSSQMHFLQTASEQSNHETFKNLPTVPESDPATSGAQSQQAASRSHADEARAI